MLAMSDSGRQAGEQVKPTNLLDGHVIPRLESEGYVGELVEVISLHHSEDRGCSVACQVSLKPVAMDPASDLLQGSL